MTLKRSALPQESSIRFGDFSGGYAASVAVRVGIGKNTDHTLKDVGQQFSVTRERIRQIEAKALRKPEYLSRSRMLRSFLDS